MAPSWQRGPFVIVKNKAVGMKIYYIGSRVENFDPIVAIAIANVKIRSPLVGNLGNDQISVCHGSHEGEK